MSSAKLEQLLLDIEELRNVQSTVQRPRVKDIILIEIRKLETEVSKLREQLLQQSSVSSGTKPVSSGPTCYTVKLTNYAWDQSDKFVKIFVDLKNVQNIEAGNVSCKFMPRGMELKVMGLENRNYTLTIINLLENIEESKSYWKVKTDMVVVFLAKSMTSKHWPHLIASEMKAKEPKVPDMDPNEDPSAGLMNLMKKMYEEGDDEMKRSIAKAWTEGREKNANL